jgi:hypothetical protein
MKTKTSNARKAVKVTDATPINATVKDVDTNCYVSQNSECHIILCSPFSKFRVYVYVTEFGM